MIPEASRSERRAVVMSFADCAHYLVGYTETPVGWADEIEVVRDARGRAEKFPSLYAAKRWLAQHGADKAWLVMQTPYDEMVGRPTPEETMSEIPLVLVEQDHR
ncbi:MULTISPECIES: DUF6482 family protein [Marinimicrobium]|uniref:Uncharacterized protein n=1 Tax=Marinimicrobium koreense TaxID=306545 RepID=A0A3N1NW09_9GAMM|nr:MULTISPECIES: DUF6482 family protein [Marinimicrobium]ROQ18600.1 hypothetical protein EDC38_2828 [Marinimicrobium koreense]